MPWESPALRIPKQLSAEYLATSVPNPPPPSIKPVPNADNIDTLLEDRAFKHKVLGTKPVRVVDDELNEYARAEAIEASVDHLWKLHTSIASQEEQAYMDDLAVCGRNIPNNNNRRSPKPKAKMPHQPPPLAGVVSGTHTFRFKQVEGLQTIHLYPDDLAFLMCVARSSSSLTPVWSHLRVNEIKMWAPTQVLSGNVQDPKVSSLTWTGDYSPNAEKFSTSNVQAGVATLSGKPSRLIEAGKWQEVGQGVDAKKICSLVVPDQSIVDIRVSFIYRDKESTSIIVTPSSAVTAGNIYYRAADSYYGTNKLVPMALLTRT